jgi:hypothetical protein
VERTASAPRFVLDATDWQGAGLHHDAEAMAWLERFSPAMKTLRFELLDEGVLAYHRLVAEKGDTYASCSGVGALVDDVITVRRLYHGPIPAQVLAEFRAVPRDVA